MTFWTRNRPGAKYSRQNRSRNEEGDNRGCVKRHGDGPLMLPKTMKI